MTSPESPPPGFVSWDGPIRAWGNKLPHWQQMGVCCFVTFRLADSIPAALWQAFKKEREEWRKDHPEPWDEATEAEYHRTFSGQVERWLDQGMGSCALRRREMAEVVLTALRHFEGERTTLHSAVVMPNHVHALVTLLPGHALEEIMKSWKGCTSREINLRLKKTGQAFWQERYFDRLIRDWPHFANVVRYIRRNPVKARLGEAEFLLWEGEWAAKALEGKEAAHS